MKIFKKGGDKMRRHVDWMSFPKDVRHKAIALFLSFIEQGAICNIEDVALHVMKTHSERS